MRDVSMEIYDRYGALVFKNHSNNYVWDGKVGGRPLPTASYWYLLKWLDPNTQLKQEYSGWILLKNRE